MPWRPGTSSHPWSVHSSPMAGRFARQLTSPGTTMTRVHSCSSSAVPPLRLICVLASTRPIESDLLSAGKLFECHATYLMVGVVVRFVDWKEEMLRRTFLEENLYTFLQKKPLSVPSFDQRLISV